MWVPVGVEDNDGVSRGQIEPETPGLKEEKERNGTEGKQRKGRKIGGRRGRKES